MKRLLAIEVDRRVLSLGLVLCLASLTGCTNKMKLLDARVDAAHKRLDGLSDEIQTYNEESKDRSAGHDAAIRQLESSLTSRFTVDIKALDAAGKKRSLAHKTAIRELEDNLSSRFTEQMQAYDAASKERSAGHEAAIHQLEDSLTAQIASQRQALHEENANLRKSLYALRTEIDKVNEADAKTQLSLSKTASQEDLERRIKDVHKRHADTQRVLEAIVKSSAEAAQISTDIRTAMQRLIEAHAFFVKGGTDLIAALEAEKAEGKAGAGSVYLGILYEQRKAQKRLLKEMQSLLLKATGELQDASDAKDAQSQN